MEMLDEFAALRLGPAVLVADTRYGANADFRHALEEGGPAYARQVRASRTRTPPAARPARHRPGHQHPARPAVRAVRP
ncbi:transposase [Streptomyces sp. NPDC052016]|uniref:transposase n=1 Tax=Streptomyces sp. NPDC052016 TaxID=3365680 RepID=UPI0037D4597D